MLEITGRERELRSEFISGDVYIYIYMPESGNGKEGIIFILERIEDERKIKTKKM